MMNFALQGCTVEVADWRGQSRSNCMWIRCSQDCLMPRYTGQAGFKPAEVASSEGLPKEEED